MSGAQPQESDTGIDVFLVRHGEAAASWGQSSDPGLSDLGHRQAREVATMLLPRLPANVSLISSPLARARETAAPLSAALSLPVQLADSFREIPSTVPLAERQEWLKAFMRESWGSQPPELLEWREAAFQGLLGLQQPAVVFSHFLVINAVAGRLQQRDETLCFWPANASVTHLRLAAGQLELVALGEEMASVIN